MFKTSIIPLLTLGIGIAIGWGISEASVELSEIESDIDNARDRINALKFFDDKEKSDFICFETWLTVSGLFEAKAVKEAKPILHWIKPNILKKANQLEDEMKSFLRSRKHEVCNGLPYPVSETLVELGYDL